MNFYILSPLQHFSQSYYSNFIRPNSVDEDRARREYIFNILMNGFLALTILAFIVSLTSYLANGKLEENISPYTLIVPILLLLGLYKLARKKFNDSIVYVFIGIYALLGTYGLYLYSFTLSQGLLVYALVIIMSGILISSRAALIMTVLIAITLSSMAYLQINNMIHSYTEGLTGPFEVQDVAVYLIIFMIIFLVSWLSSREIERSLKRARNSEKLLRAERNFLEIKVKERTKELEKSQVEKTMELYRFAEFGRLSSSLLHDLSNPLTAVSLIFGQLETNQKSAATIQVRDGITHMEQYVHSARRQLCSQSEKKNFDSKEVIEKVIGFLLSKGHSHKVKLVKKLSKDCLLFGDDIKFSQIIANLIANGIDSYNGIDISTSRSVTIISKVDPEGKALVILVCDNGAGIPEAERSRIFEPFYTTKSSDRGTGIGLTITKQIIENDFNGHICVDTYHNKGTNFIVTIPLK